MIRKAFARCLKPDSMPFWMVTIIAVVEVILCLDYHEQRWDRAVMRQDGSVSLSGEGFIIQWNGLGYYAWLRSPLIDGDWDFDNEFDEHNPQHYYVPPPLYRTPRNRRANQWSVGPACVWAFTVVPAHFLIWAGSGTCWPWAANGYSLPYQLVVGATSLAVALTGLFFLYGLCRTQAGPVRAALAVALLTLGSTIVYYSAIEISLPHGAGTTALAAAVWYWLTTYGSVRPGRWFLVGLLIGVAALFRWQLLTFALLPVAETLLGYFKRLRAHLRSSLAPGTAESFGLLLLAVLGTLLGALPQMIAWRIVYGSWLAVPIQGVHYHWWSPSLWEILCSQDRSLFYWTPVSILACIGAAVCLVPTRASDVTSDDFQSGTHKELLVILLAAFAIQVYALASMWGKGAYLETTGNFAGIFLARSYGFRDLTESLIVLAPGLAWLLEHSSQWTFRLLAGLGLALATWNLLLVSLYTNNMIPSEDGASPFTLVTQVVTLIREQPLFLLQAALGPILIAFLLWLGDGQTAEDQKRAPM